MKRFCANQQLRTGETAMRALAFHVAFLFNNFLQIIAPSIKSEHILTRENTYVFTTHTFIIYISRKIRPRRWKSNGRWTTRSDFLHPFASQIAVTLQFDLFYGRTLRWCRNEFWRCRSVVRPMSSREFGWSCVTK